MSFKRWLALLLFYISYLFFGASIYYFIEHTEEVNQRAIEANERVKINAYITENLKGNDNQKYDILSNITEYCGKKVTPIDKNELEDPFRWSFYHAFFFAFTVCSTVGYGNLSPSTTLGRMVLIAYSLIGMPVNTILFAGLGEYFARLFRYIHIRYKNYKMSNNDLYIPKQFGLIATIAIALVPGIIIFLVLPSCIFSYFEGWPFSLSFYYSYVTTTTIGFGDYVPTFQPHQERYFGGQFIAYQIFVIVWFIFSLGYFLMIIGYITKGFRSKKLRELERQLKHNIKNTQTRIWHGVVKDVGYLRKLINEVYLNVKPIYNELGPSIACDIHRSLSCPDLTMYSTTSPILSRKRAYSECYNKLTNDNQIHGGYGTPINRASSDTDLNKINKEKTFETMNAFRETTTLLANVVSALGNIQQPPQYDFGGIAGGEESSLNSSLFGAYHGFTDSQILLDEMLLNNSGQNSELHPHHRERSSSDFFINPKTIPAQKPYHHNEWTWCGDNQQIQQEINDRVKLNKNNKNLAKTALFNSTLNNSVILNLDNTYPLPTSSVEQKRKKSRKFSSDFVFDLFKRRSSNLDITKNQRKDSIDITNIGNIQGINEKSAFNSIIQNNYPNVISNNSSLKSVDKKSGSSSLKNRSNETIPSSQDQPPDINQIRQFGQRKGSLYPFLNNNMLNETRDPLGIRKSLPRNSIFYNNKKNRSGSLAYPTSTISTPSEKNRSRTSSLNYDHHRKSLESVASDKKSEYILENTSLADLIRALELLHTRAVTQGSGVVGGHGVEHHLIPTIPELNEKSIPKTKTRKIGTSTPPKLSPIFTIFSNDKNPDITTNINIIEQQNNDKNRTIAALKNSSITTRRPSLFNTTNNTINSNSSNTETGLSGIGQFNKRDQQPTDINKYGRRFSVRPVTDLQTGQLIGQSPIVTSYPTALQRKLSVRLSKDFNRTSSPLATIGIGGTTTNTGGAGSSPSSGNSSIRGSTRRPSSQFKQTTPIQSNKQTTTPVIPPVIPSVISPAVISSAVIIPVIPPVISPTATTTTATTTAQTTVTNSPTVNINSPSNTNSDC